MCKHFQHFCQNGGITLPGSLEGGEGWEGEAGDGRAGHPLPGLGHAVEHVRVLGAPLDGLHLHILHLELGHAGGLGGLPLETGPSVPHCEHPLVKESTKFRGKENSEIAHLDCKYTSSTTPGLQIQFLLGDWSAEIS